MYKDKILEIIEKLSDNAMFSMSLTSRELFHSNVWAWMIRKYPKIFTSVFYPKYDGKSEVKVFREENNNDLLLKINDKHIIIENKFKCMPNQNQLKKYYNECKNEKKEIKLISYFKPTFSLSEMNFYEDIKNGLQKALNNSKSLFSRKINSIEKDDYVIIKNYINFLELLNNLKSSIIINSDDKIDDLIKIIKDLDIQKEAEKINFSKTIEKIFISKLTETVLEGFEFKGQIDKIDIDCGRDLKVYSDILFYFPGAWDDDEEKRRDLCYLGVSLWGKYYRYYAGLHKAQCGITKPKNGRRDKENKQAGYDYLCKEYSEFFKPQSTGTWGGYSNDKEMYLYKKIDISNYTVEKLKKKVQADLEKVYTIRENKCHD